ncbi:hypothetical protein L2E82_15154 [Cichorium intybus]|uniref:Uncharacterized protein n=1 Tax=Cichorium intybus TaxID=13427 RepID=A0ACB9F1D0_CICIN|nr:hypothetical protein L2E82_15154 [Cichorium intybus]
MLTSSSRRTIASGKCVLPPLSESPAEAYTPLTEGGEVDERNIDMRRVISKKNSRNRLLPYQRGLQVRCWNLEQDAFGRVWNGWSGLSIAPWLLPCSSRFGVRMMMEGEAAIVASDEHHLWMAFTTDAHALMVFGMLVQKRQHWNAVVDCHESAASHIVKEAVGVKGLQDDTICILVDLLPPEKMIPPLPATATKDKRKEGIEVHV